MPELPDLQVFSRNLTRLLANKKIRKVNIIRAKKIKTPASKLRAGLEGAKVKKVERSGKELHFFLSNKNVLAIHLMLRGELHFFEGTHAEKFGIIELIFADNSGLVVSDYQGQATPTLNPPAHDGVDALSEKMNSKFLAKILASSKASVKNLLLDQHVIRGIGNAYVDEILWDARISPFSIANKIPEASVKALAKSIRKVLRQAEKNILKSNPDIISGEVRDFLKIHNSKKEKSPLGAPILIHQGGGRKTYYTEEQELYK